MEFFDFYIFGTAAALVFGPLFFPSESTAAQQLAAEGRIVAAGWLLAAVALLTLAGVKLARPASA